ncbi:glycosyltransferase [Glycomyces sp. NPDC046736]|uniref:glycosyltransferase n=1 Tax=Glycomyces sp. NPDC046736 TaxID=3155615 RepID=UPI0033E0C59D
MNSDTTPSVHPDPLCRNDYGALEPVELGQWTPELGVSVVVPAFGNQRTLDLCLAGLAAQSYPAELVEVIVVDDGSAPPLQLPETAPESTRVVANPGPDFGIAAAVDTGVRAAAHSFVLRIDSDVIPDRLHVEAHMRWHHQVEYAVVIGKVAVVDRVPDLEPAAVLKAVADGNGWDLFEGIDVDREWRAKLIDKYDQLKALDSRAYVVANGASVSFNRAMYTAVGGLDRTMALGEDTELAYRLAQGGAVFIPERHAECWHLGVPQMHSRADEGRRYREPAFADRIPLMRKLRDQPGGSWEVPLVEVTVTVGEARYEQVRDTVRSVLGGTLTDVRVSLVGPWESLAVSTRAPLDDDRLELRLISRAFAADARVRYVQEAPDTPAPAPFGLSLPPGVVCDRDALRGLIALADDRRAGRVNLALSDHEGLAVAVLDRTAALARAMRFAEDGADLDSVVHAVWGVLWENGDDWFGDDLAALAASPRSMSLASENERLRRERSRQRARIGELETLAEEARRSAADWEVSAGRWERAAGTWQLKAAALTSPSPRRRGLRSWISRSLRGRR